VRGQQGGQPGGRELARHGDEQLAVGDVAAGVDDGTGVAVDDQELVRLHRFAALVGEAAEHQAAMTVAVVEYGGHARL